MRIETIEKAIYSYSELSDAAKEKAMSQWSQNMDYEFDSNGAMC